MRNFIAETNQRRAIEALQPFAVEAAAAIRRLQAQADANSRALDALTVLVGRLWKPEAAPVEIVESLIAIRREMDACEAVSAV